MGDIKVTVNGQSAVISNFTANAYRMTLEARSCIQQAGVDCEKYAKQACPVGTPESTHKKGYRGGTLRRSIRYKRQGEFSCSVGTNVVYAPFVEFGTSKMRAQPFLYPAYQRAMSELLDNLRSIDV